MYGLRVFNSLNFSRSLKVEHKLLKSDFFFALISHFGSLFELRRKLVVWRKSPQNPNVVFRRISSREQVVSSSFWGSSDSFFKALLSVLVKNFFELWNKKNLMDVIKREKCFVYAAGYVFRKFPSDLCCKNKII